MVILLALLLGGTSVRGIPTTFAVQLAATALLLLGWSDAERRAPRLAIVLLAGVLALHLLQLLPLGGLWGSAGQGEESLGLPAPLALSVDMGRTLQSLVDFIPIAAFVLIAASSTEDELNGVLPWFFLGVILNCGIAVVQLTSPNGLGGLGLPYDPAAGIFANPNHFTTLMVMAIPLAVYQGVIIKRPLLSVAPVVVLIALSFAAGSIAGSLLSLASAVFSYAVVLKLPAVPRILLAAATGIGAIIVLLNPGNVLQVRADNPLDRQQIWATTLAAIPSYLPFGAGMGTFEIVYPAFESVEAVQREFVNHAHNEYLELLLEGGLPAAIFLLASLGLLAWRSTQEKSRFQTAALTALLFVLLHSMVDYPLRTAGLGLAFALFAGVVASPSQPRLTTVPARN